MVHSDHMSKKTDKKLIASNKRAFHEYQVVDKFEAGIVLVGCEVKSIRNGHIVIKDSFARFKGTELWLMNCYIGPYEQASHFQPDPERDRKLLLHRAQLKKMLTKVTQKGYYVIPLRFYLFHQLVKVEIGLCTSKKKHDKRQDLKEKDINRDISRALKSR